jgi:exosortase sorting signal-containing protein
MSMNKTTRMKISKLSLLLGSTVSGKVLASGAAIITYAPTPPPVPITPTAAPLAGAVGEAIQVPTLGGAALMVLSFILAVVAVRIIKAQKASGTNLVAFVTAATSLIVGAGGITLASSPVEAVVTPTEIPMTEDGGELFVTFPDIYYWAVNSASKPMTISKITVINSSCSLEGQPSGALNDGAPVGQCAVNMDIEPGDYCEIKISCPPPP